MNFCQRLESGESRSVQWNVNDTVMSKGWKKVDSGPSPVGGPSRYKLAGIFNVKFAFPLKTASANPLPSSSATLGQLPSSSLPRCAFLNGLTVVHPFSLLLFGVQTTVDLQSNYAFGTLLQIQYGFNTSIIVKCFSSPSPHFEQGAIARFSTSARWHFPNSHH